MFIVSRQLWVRILTRILWSHGESGQAGECLVPGYDGSEWEVGDKSTCRRSVSFWLYRKAKCKTFCYYSVTLVFPFKLPLPPFHSQGLENRELLERPPCFLYLPLSLPKISLCLITQPHSRERENINHNNKLLPCLPGSNETLFWELVFLHSWVL